MSSAKRAFEEEEEEGQRVVKGSHPLDVRPWGTLLFENPGERASIASRRAQGLGDFAALQDVVILSVLQLLDAKSLGALSCTSRTFLSYASHDDLWRALAFDEFRTSETRFYSTWKECYWRNVLKLKLARRKPTVCTYSDLLYQSWYCANLEIPREWVERQNVPRCANLSKDEFVERFERPNRPVIITDVVTKWPAFSKWGDRRYIVDAFENELVHVGGYQFDMNQYYEYIDKTNDEMPLYLFDKEFAAKSPVLKKDYEVPAYFEEDLFQVLGERERPDYRWLIIGPAKSGSSFHIDPNCTSAWNAVLSGRKKWVMFPPKVVPPGVHASENGLNVATSVSIIEWFLNFYQEAREGTPDAPAGAMRECVVEAGEVIFVPRGWWHLVINLEESVALTQNYVSSANLGHVLRYIRKGDLVSGCSREERETLHRRFTERLRERRPDLDRIHVKKREGEAGEGGTNLASVFEKGGSNTGETAFKFNFF